MQNNDLTPQQLLGLGFQFYDEPEFHDAAHEATILSPMPGQAEFDKERIDLATKAKTVPADLRFVYMEPLLTKPQEQHLFRAFNFHKARCHAARQGIKDGRSRQAIDLANKHWRMAQKVKGQVVCSNTRLILSICKKQRHYNDNPSVDKLIELMSDGMVGLVRAVDYYDYRLNYKFSTYATWAILDTLKRAKMSGDRHAANFVNGFEELLHQQIDKERPEPFLDGDFVTHILASLHPKLRRVLVMYYGINRRKCFTLQEIAEKLNLSKERVRQLRDRAVLELKRFVAGKAVLKAA